MRKYHRWISLPSGLLLLFMGITGSLLAIDDMTSPSALERRGGAPAGKASTASPLPLAQASRLLDNALRAARADGGDVASIRLFAQDGDVRAEIERIGKPPLAVDALTGTPIAAAGAAAGGPPGVPAWRVATHGWLEYLHRGAFASWPGIVAVMLAGIALIALSVTGLLVYLDMFRRRRQNGRNEWFWR
ncbi:MAG: PepSY-associated TM helix domain-containing protein [Pseudoxanthomonas sp.]